MGITALISRSGSSGMILKLEAWNLNFTQLPEASRACGGEEGTHHLASVFICNFLVCSIFSNKMVYNRSVVFTWCTFLFE